MANSASDRLKTPRALVRGDVAMSEVGSHQFLNAGRERLHPLNTLGGVPYLVERDCAGKARIENDFSVRSITIHGGGIVADRNVCLATNWV